MVRIHFDRKFQVFVAIGLVILLADVAFFLRTIFFVPVFAIAVSTAWLPFWLGIFAENRRQKELESRFPDFVRNLSGAIRSGIPASQAVIQVAETDYGALTPYVKKLSHQLEWALPFHTAFLNFGKESNNIVIKRAIATMIQAEQAGGNIEDVLTAITDSLIQIKKIKEERKAGIHAQVMQNYIIFTVFLAIMILIQNVLIPYMADFNTAGDTGLGITQQAAGGIDLDARLSFTSPLNFLASLGPWLVSIQGVFLMMAMLQGFFAGVVLGKLAEGDLTSGLKHSLIMVTMSFMSITFAQSIVG
jgi:archaeal flagellar protein FlaJ